MFNLFKKKSGCLDGKTEQQKKDFFKSLYDFATTDRQFFKEQYLDMLPKEREQFAAWVAKQKEQNKIMLDLVKTIGELLELKHGKQNHGETYSTLDDIL